MLQALIEGRRAAGLRQIDLSERLEKPQSFVSKFENGERRIDVVELLVIANAIGLDVHILIDHLKSLLKPGTRI